MTEPRANMNLAFEKKIPKNKLLLMKKGKGLNMVTEKPSGIYLWA